MDDRGNTAGKSHSENQPFYSLSCDGCRVTLTRPTLSAVSVGCRPVCRRLNVRMSKDRACYSVAVRRVTGCAIFSSKSQEDQVSHGVDSKCRVRVMLQEGSQVVLAIGAVVFLLKGRHKTKRQTNQNWQSLYGDIQRFKNF